MKRYNFVYRNLKRFGINFSEGEYSEITIASAFNRVLKGLWNSLLLKYCMYSIIFSPLNYRVIRPKLWRLMGCDVGRDVFIGYDVWMDFNNASLISVGDGAHITNRCLLLCHQRDLTDYYCGDDSTKLPYKKGAITIGKGVMIGMGTIVLPGVTIGDGSIVGAGSIVSCDVPEWSIAVGRPARVIKSIPQRKIK